MANDHMQTARFELKYLITEGTAQCLRDRFRSFLTLDAYCAEQPDFSYPVHSLYMDSIEMKTYWDTINGVKNRFKLRIRFYDDQQDSPVFVEIKQHMSNGILKLRAGVRRETVPRILAGQLPPAAALAAPNPKHLFALQTFYQLVQEMQATPKIHVAYQREAYATHMENSVRLTMDRCVRSEPTNTTRPSTVMRDPILVWGKAVLLEVKFTDSCPDWFKELAHDFELRHCGAAKYADGITLLSGHLPQHRNLPHPNSDFHWQVENAYCQTHGNDIAEPPSYQAVALAVRHPEVEASQERNRHA